MKIAILTILHPDMIRQYYQNNPSSLGLPFKQQEEEFNRTVSLWAGGWARAFADKGWDAQAVTINNGTLLRQWALENAPALHDADDIAMEQLRRFGPDILWYDYFDLNLLKRLREKTPSLRLVLGWSGSAIVDDTILRSTDAILSCAPEVVETYRQQGLRAYQVHHAFDPRLLEALPPRSDRYPCTFVGQVLRGGDLHRQREAFLLDLVDALDLRIFSPSYNLGIKDTLRSAGKKIASYALFPFFSSSAVKQQNAYLKEILRSHTMPWMPYNKKLHHSMSAPVYGVPMLATLRQSRVVLNIHADSSTRFASNMRLFETTGAGACLLTDWKSNLGDLFQEGTEMVSYRSSAECIERARWLLDHSAERETIAARGHQKTLSRHSFGERIHHLLDLIQELLRQ